jgi:hypothetical protein
MHISFGYGIENFLALHTYIHKQGLTAGPSYMDLLLSLLDVEFNFHLNVAQDKVKTPIKLSLFIKI